MATDAAADGRERDAITAAMDRLLAGTPLRTTGKLTILELAAEAGLKRHHLTHKHTDLKDLFAARVKANESVPDAQRRLVAENEQLRAEIVDLRCELGTVEAAYQAALRQIHVLAVDLDDRDKGTARVRQLHAAPSQSPAS